MLGFTLDDCDNLWGTWLKIDSQDQAKKKRKRKQEIGLRHVGRRASDLIWNEESGISDGDHVSLFIGRRTDSNFRPADLHSWRTLHP